MAESGQVRQSHYKTVLRLIQRHPDISKPQIAKQTGLTPSAVHGIISFLEQKGVIACTGAAGSSGGRKPSCYAIPKELGFFVGVSIRIDRLEIGLFDMNLGLKRKSAHPLNLSENGPETYASFAAQAIEREIAAGNVPREDCFGVGVTVPGPVDFEKGTVLEIAAAPLWQQYPLAHRLVDALALPVAVDKDVYAGIRYLQHVGKIKRRECAAFLSICEGIGAALVIHGEVFRGSHSLSGEIGHLTVRKDGIPCSCGNTGCLELYCSDIGIVKQYNAQTGGNCQRVEDVISLTEKGDPVAHKVFAQAVGYLVDTTCTIIMNYDPEELLIYCTWLNKQRALYFKMLDALYAKSIFTKLHTVDISLMEPEPINLPAAASLAALELSFRSGSRLMAMLEED